MQINQSINFIAEVSANHLGSLQRAKEIVHAAARSGATTVKFQTYTAETMTLNLPKFAISQSHELWGNSNLYDLYESAHTPWEWHGELFELARSLNLVPFSSPFDLTAVDFLESLNCAMYKIASMETGDHQLIEAVAKTGKPIIMSTGASEWEEIQEAVNVVKSTGNKNLTLLVCTSSYPSHPRDSHVNRMETLRKAFNCDVGLSDHTLGIGVSIAAITLGATAIEKHLTLKRTDGGADGAFSMEPNEFEALVREGKAAKEGLGAAEWKMLDSEFESRRLRRSLYVVKNVRKGDIVTTENLRAIRPNGGAKPRFLESFLGKKFAQDCEPGTPMDSKLLEN
jgi:pseudaminic acid synthase